MDWKKFFEPSWAKLIALIIILLINRALFFVSVFKGVSFTTILHPFVAMSDSVKSYMAIAAAMNQTLCIIGQMIIDLAASVFDYAWQYFLACGAVHLYSKYKRTKI